MALQSGWPTPVDHHLRPLTTTSSPSTTAVAVVVGSFSAFVGGWVDSLLMEIANVWLTVPHFPLLAVLAVLVKLDRLLDENRETISGTLKNAETFTKTLADNSQQISSFIKDASEAAHSLKPVVARLDKFLATGEQAIKAIDPKQIKTITGNIAGASSSLKNFSTNGLRQYEQLAVDARKAVDTLDQAIKSIERDPSQFIWGPSQQTPEYRGR